MKIKVKGQSLSIVDKYLTVSDTENVYEVEFEFDDAWDGFSKTACFKKDGGTIYSVVLDSTLKCRIPNEVVADSGYIYFGVLGTKTVGTETKRYPTIWTERMFVDVACASGSTPTPPTPSVYAQILSAYEATNDRVDEVEEDIEALDTRLDTAESDIDDLEQSVDELESGKVDKVEGKGLSTNDYDNNEKTKVSESYSAKHTHDNKSILDTITQALINTWNTVTGKQDTLVSGTNIKTINGSSILGSGNINIGGAVDSVNGKTGVVILNASDVGALPDSTVIPTKTSDITNDSGFITNTVNNLTNYYLKTSTYTKSEVDAIIATIKQFTYEVVSVLPTASASTMHKIYLVPSSSSSVQNVKDEFITIENSGTYSWEQIGSTQIDLSNYYTKSETDSAISNHHDSTKANVADLATVATSGSYDDLSDTPTIPSKTSELQNDSGFIDNTYHDASKQNETDISLNTTSKQIVGAINEVKSTADGKIAKVANATADNIPQLNASGELTNGLGTTNAQGIPIVTSISSASTNAQVPSAKGVYDCVVASKNTIKTSLEAIAVVNSDYYLGTQSTVAIVLPSSASIGDTISVIFYSGSTATTLSISGNTIGTVVVPATNQRVEISMLYDGTYWAILSNTMSSV